MMPLLGGGLLYYLPSILCAVHVVRTGQPMYWLRLLIIGGPLGAAVYFFAVMLPDMMGGRAARGMGRAALNTLDPERDYRNAMKALDDTPTPRTLVPLFFGRAIRSFHLNCSEPRSSASFRNALVA